MNTILTDDEIEDAWCKYGDEMGGADQSDALRIGREIEAAVLAKLREQEPVGYLPSYEADRLKSGHDARLRSAKFGPSQLDGDVPIYTHPAPLPAVVQVPQGTHYPDMGSQEVPSIGSEWSHSNGDTYTVTGYADMFSENHQKRPPRVIYRSAKTGRVWSRELSDWHRAMTFKAAAPEAPPTAAERHLRRLLAVRVGMPHAYYDDGEAHGTEQGIQIDFTREPVADIDAKLRALNVALAAAIEAPSATNAAILDATTHGLGVIAGGQRIAPEQVWKAPGDHTEQHLEMVPAPWREAVKVAREALHSLLFTADDSASYDACITEARAALAQLDALEGGE